ncbi:MAG: sigma-54 dependent transcriptional regulator [Holosporales bacterium]|jgi:two-component system nitrogen regulation response regulator NtrX|nr:sigma-54 dependent transcriptional regulator [Holosporales bacterium]
MAFNILIVDDEADIRELVSGILSDNGYETEAASHYVEAVASIQKKRPNLVIIDVWLGENDKDGLRLLEFIKVEYEYVPAIMMSGHSTIETAVTAIKHGAHDFIEKPFDSHRLLTSVEKAIEISKLKMENADLKIKARYSEAILGDSPNSVYVRQSIEKLAQVAGRCVILGPNGSNKEAIAREIHRLSKRSRSPFGVLNCKSFGVRQLESEFLGSEIVEANGVKIKQGMLEKLNGGTLFIDELGVASTDFQLKFLKILKEDTFSRIGSREKLHLGIRIIAGLPLDIAQLVKNEKFIDELFCRLNANMIKIVPLSSRKEDILVLLEHFMERSAKAHGVAPKKFSNEAIGVLKAYSWPGNELQLKNLVEWVLTMSVSSNDDDISTISVDALPSEIMWNKKHEITEIPFISAVSEMSIREARETFERKYLLDQLKKFSGNISQTSKFIGMERSALHRKLKSLNLTDIRLVFDEDEG